MGVLAWDAIKNGVRQTNATMGIQAGKEAGSHAVPALLLVRKVVASLGIPKATREAKVDDIDNGRGRRRSLPHDEIGRLYVAMYK